MTTKAILNYIRKTVLKKSPWYLSSSYTSRKPRLWLRRRRSDSNWVSDESRDLRKRWESRSYLWKLLCYSCRTKTSLDVADTDNGELENSMPRHLCNSSRAWGWDLCRATRLALCCWSVDSPCNSYRATLDLDFWESSILFHPATRKKSHTIVLLQNIPPLEHRRRTEEYRSTGRTAKLPQVSCIESLPPGDESIDATDNVGDVDRLISLINFGKSSWRNCCKLLKASSMGGMKWQWRPNFDNSFPFGSLSMILLQRSID